MTEVQLPRDSPQPRDRWHYLYAQQSKRLAYTSYETDPTKVLGVVNRQKRLLIPESVQS
jgi:hypothetical protein